VLLRDGADARGVGGAVASGRRDATGFAGLARRFAADRFAVALFVAVFFAAAFFGIFVAGRFLTARPTVFFAAFLTFFGARAFVIVVFAFVFLRLLVFRAPAFLLGVFASETRPATERRGFTRDFLAGFFLAGATTIPYDSG
jgi:hypothetical protein